MKMDVAIKKISNVVRRKEIGKAGGLAGGDGTGRMKELMDLRRELDGRIDGRRLHGQVREE